MIQRWIAVGTLLGLFGAPTTSYATTSGEETVSGSWLNAVPCVLTNYSNETGSFTCTGSSVWLGAWEGVTAFEFKAVMDRSTESPRHDHRDVRWVVYRRARSGDALIY